MTPVSAAFIAMIGILQAPLPCAAPHEAYSSDFVVQSCQAGAVKGHTADSCYLPPAQTVVLPSSCAGAGIDDHHCNVLAYHEVCWHIYKTCFGRTFTDAEPQEILDCERHAP